MPLKSLKRFGLSETGVQTPQSIDAGKTIVNHPQNHHKWLLQAIKIWVLYYYFTVLLTLGLIRLFLMGTSDVEQYRTYDPMARQQTWFQEAIVSLAVAEKPWFQGFVFVCLLYVFLMPFL